MMRDLIKPEERTGGAFYTKKEIAELIFCEVLCAVMFVVIVGFLALIFLSR